jgi:predicted TIM-barrel fold metal-dependent hydrolase
MPDTPASEICDCHVHVVGPSEEFPQAEGRAYTAGPATVESLRSVANRLGVGRFVLVQPSFYGSDNSYLLRTLETLKGRGRGVVVFDPGAIGADSLRQYAQRGVCGVRINLYSKLRVAAPAALKDILARCTAQLPDAGWHLEIIAPLPVLAAAAPAIAGSALPIVIDHYGLPGDAEPESALGRCLLDLLRLSHVWIKLSAPYRAVADPLATTPPAAWLSALLRAAPERCVWGSDWPYTPRRQDQTDIKETVPYRPLDYRRVLEHFATALSSASVADQILRANPERLYRFRAPGNER